MEEAIYYDGNRLLQTKDLNRRTPEIFVATSNRSDGKTTFFGRKMLKDWVNSGKRFGLLLRNVKELEDIGDQFFKELTRLFFDGAEYGQKPAPYGASLQFEGKECGYAFSLKQADTIKRFSHLLSDCMQYLFDEFQAKQYLRTEIKDFISIHTSIARGGGKQVRYVPVYMCSNKLSLLNPYFTSMGISSRLRTGTKILRGTGWVLEQHYNKHAYEQQQASGFMQAFSGIDDGAQMVYLEENESFIGRPKSAGRYLCTICFEGHEYGISEYMQEGILYAHKGGDHKFPQRFVVSAADHGANMVMVARNSLLITELRSMFEAGCFRFSDIETKAAVLQLLSY